MKPISLTLQLGEELSNVQLETKGTIPKWLTGALIRNGPISFAIDGKNVEHWFDGLAMLHAFSFQQGRVYYSNKFIRSKAFTQVFKEGSFHYEGFAVDPCRSLFQKLITFFSAHSPEIIQNANINVAKLADEYVSFLETPLPVRFDLHTLETLGVFNYDDKLPHAKCWESAHPHPLQNYTVSYLVDYGRQSYYVLYKIAQGSSERQVIAKIPVDEPSYMHSFSVTENFAIFTEYPYVVKPLDFILKNRPFIKNYFWDATRGTQFLVINRHTGDVVGRYRTKPFFAFHHINAFEKDQSIILDVASYDNADIIWEIADYSYETPKKNISLPRLERFTLSLKSEEVHFQTIFNDPIELPRINSRIDGEEYEFVYGIDPRPPMIDQDIIRPIYKINPETKKSLNWSESGCYPGEAIFIHSPDSQDEDDGVVASVVFDSITKQSFLLILEAKSFKELGRAIVTHAIPAGLHGQYLE